MTTTGRPRATTRETISEAACELFLEQGYERTTVADIAARSGVGRSSFFNYFASKADVVWSGFDARLDTLERRLAEGVDARAALADVADGFAPDALALALANARQMGAEQELEREADVRRGRIARAVRRRLESAGSPGLAAEVVGAAGAGALLAAIEAWARVGAGRTALAVVLAEALDTVPFDRVDAAVRQLRVVVQAPQFNEALTFYRDRLGLVELASYEGEGDARVAILSAGAATLELANTGQVALIDGVETDGDAPSDRVRVGIEVLDTDAVVERLVEAGAVVEASARETPWRSRNARLRGAAGLQLTVFQELGDSADGTA